MRIGLPKEGGDEVREWNDKVVMLNEESGWPDAETVNEEGSEVEREAGSGRRENAVISEEAGTA